MFKFLTDQGVKRNLSGFALMFKNIISIGAALYLIFAVLFYPEPILHRSIAFGLFYAVIFMSYSTPGSKISDRIPVYDWILAGLSVSVSVYMAVNFSRILNRIIFVDPVLAADKVFGIMTIVLLLEGTRRVVGPWLPGLSLLALAYIIFGHNIAGRFGTIKFSSDYIIDGLFLTNFGIWGRTMGIATGKIMVFLLFGTLFKKTGAGDFLFDFVSRIAGRRKGGVAKVAILSSAMFGMVSGSAMTNATTTGAMTIPAMKKSGFDKDYAASIESCASVGGIFMPPIMGSVAFIMSEVVGIPYIEVIKRAFLPAIVYFASLFFAVDFKARKLGIAGTRQKSSESIWSLILRGYNFFIPLAFLIFRLMSGRTAAKAGLETIVLMIILGIFNRKKPISFKMIFDSLKASVNRGVMIVSTMATCGILVGVIDNTGVTSKFSSYLRSVADVSVILTLLVVMLATLFLGLAMNISTSYLIAAVLGAPILIGLGFEKFSVHMFILFFAGMATITPPVAITSYAAATISGSNPMKVGFMSMKVGLVAYILPFVFIYNPAILQFGSFFEIMLALIFSIAGTGILAMGLEGWLFGLKTDFLVRAGLVAAGIMVVMGQMLFIGIAIILIISVILYSYFLKGKLKNKKHMEESNEKV